MIILVSKKIKNKILRWQAFYTVDEQVVVSHERMNLYCKLGFEQKYKLKWEKADFGGKCQNWKAFLGRK